tara:strand:- start:49 stop:513 length:465 start_codon:yes stop_codon:yes gene_type:complete
MNTNNLFTAKEASKTFGCSQATLRRYRQKGVLKAGVHYRRKFAGNPNSPILYKIQECQEALEEIIVFHAKNLKTLEENLEFHVCINSTILSYFWSILDKDFGEKVDKESIHEIFDLVIPELNLEQSINILNSIDPKKLLELKKQIKQLLTKKRL